MATVFPARMMAEVDGDFVVFSIGMRINRPWKIHKLLPVARAMPRMLKELSAHPECGCLAVGGSTSVRRRGVGEVTLSRSVRQPPEDSHVP